MLRREFYQSILKWILNLPRTPNTPFLIGVNGPQGVGKTTLTHYLVEQLQQLNLNALSISIDDFYLTRKQQQQLADGTDNPYLQQRGYPGTHDIGLGQKILSHLVSQQTNFHLPRYNKSAFNGLGDRFDKKHHTLVTTKQDIVFVEGWMLGFQPVQVTSNQHLQTINNELLKYKAWTQYLNAFIYLKPVNVDQFINWRVEAEENMKKTGKEGLSKKAVTAYAQLFLPAYQLYRDTLSPEKLNLPQSFFKKIVIGPHRLPAE